MKSPSKYLAPLICLAFLGCQNAAPVLDSASADLDGDGRKETLALLDTGELQWTYHEKTQIIDCCFESSEGFPAPELAVIQQNANELHFFLTYSYPPSNTALQVYRLEEGRLKKILDLMGDQGISVEGVQFAVHWKDFQEGGGWKAATTLYAWDEEQKVYLRE